MWWAFDDEARERFKNVLKDLEEPAKQKYSKGLQLPLPTAFEARHANLTVKDMEAIGHSLSSGGRDVSPSHILWSIAWQNYEDHMFPAAVIVLGSAIETALKWHLSEKGDDIASYLLAETQSPMLPKLLSCARKHAGLDVPKDYQTWLGDLMKARNALVHQPRDLDVDPLEIGRWFAIGEAILKRAAGHDSEPLAGKLVRISKDLADFPAGTLGIVMRREIDYGEETLHVLLDSGDTRRFSETAFEQAPNQGITANRS